MNPWEQGVRAALAERRNRLEEIGREIADLERQIETCRQRLASLAADRSSVENQASVLEEIVEQAAAGVPPDGEEIASFLRSQSATPSTKSALSAPASPPSAPPSPKVEAMLDVLRGFGNKGASAKTLADACAAAGVELKNGWVSSSLSQKKKQGKVVGQNGIWWAVEHAPGNLVSLLHTVQRSPNRIPQPSLSDTIRQGLQSMGEQGAATRELFERIVTLRPETTLGAVSSCLSKLCKKGEVRAVNGRYTAVGQRTAHPTA